MFKEIIIAVVFLYWVLAIGVLIAALTKPTTAFGKTIATCIVLALFGSLPLHQWAQQRADDKQQRIDDANFKAAQIAFLDACNREGEETVPPRPLFVKHLYIHDRIDNTTGSWNSKIFDDYKGRGGKNKTDASVSIIDDLSNAIPEAGNYLLVRSFSEQKTGERITSTSVRHITTSARHELIDMATGEVKATRTNYHLGGDFVSRISCLDADWRGGFTSFVVRSIGFTPGASRSDAWVNTVQRRFAHADFRLRTTANEADFKAPISPPGSEYDYNNYKIVIDGVAYRLPLSYNSSLLRVVGVQSFPDRMLIAYEAHRDSQNIFFQIRNRHSGQLLQEIYVSIPFPLNQEYGIDGVLRPWRISQEGVSFENKKIRFDIIQAMGEGGRKAKNVQYSRYRFEAPWDAENIERQDLPAHLDDGYYGLFALPKGEEGGPVNAQRVIGKWISEPAGALWEFKEDHTLTLDETKWIWRVEDGVLSVASDNPRYESRVSFRASRDGNKLEVTMGRGADTYEPFVIKRIQSDR